MTVRYGPVARLVAFVLQRKMALSLGVAAGRASVLCSRRYLSWVGRCWVWASLVILEALLWEG